MCLNNKTVGVFHVFPSNRRVMIEELEHNKMNFRCEEINHIKNLHETKSDVVVIFSPAFLTCQMTLPEIKQLMMESDKTLIIVAYDLDYWTMERPRTFYLQQKNDRKTIVDVKTMIVMATTWKGQKHIVGN